MIALPRCPRRLQDLEAAGTVTYGHVVDRVKNVPQQTMLREPVGIGPCSSWSLALLTKLLYAHNIMISPLYFLTMNMRFGL